MSGICGGRSSLSWLCEDNSPVYLHWVHLLLLPKEKTRNKQTNNNSFCLLSSLSSVSHITRCLQLPTAGTINAGWCQQTSHTPAASAGPDHELPPAARGCSFRGASHLPLTAYQSFLPWDLWPLPGQRCWQQLLTLLTWEKPRGIFLQWFYFPALL